MVDLGILVTNLNQEQPYFNELAHVGVSSGVNLFLFLPSSIQPITKEVVGKKFCPKTNEWIDDVFPIPTFIYDRCFYKNEVEFKKHSPVVAWLKTQDGISFLGHGLPNKWVVYETLKKDDFIQAFIPKTILLKDRHQAFSFFKSKNALLFKPISGSQGKGIFVLEELGENYSLLMKKNGHPIKKQLKIKDVQHLVNKVATKYNYLLQPYLSLTNKEKRPYDIRIFLQKNHNGKWQEIGRGIRIGKEGDFTSNLATGGSIANYEDWITNFPVATQERINNNIKKLISRIPEVLENNNLPLFEIGVDVSVDRDERLWLLEVNSKPGRKVITTCYPQQFRTLAQGPINYCLFLNKVVTQ